LEENQLQKNLKMQVQNNLIILAGKDPSGKPLLDLSITTTTKLFLHGAMAKKKQSIPNYIFDAEGAWKENVVKGKGIMENEMHRIIKQII